MLSSTEWSFVSHHGIAEIVVLDNGRQFTSGEFQKLDKDWNFCHITSSPHLLSIKRRDRKSNENSQGHLATERLLLSFVNPMKAPFIGSEPSRTRLWMQTQNNSTYSDSSTHSSHRRPWYGVMVWWVWEGTTEARPRLACTYPSEVKSKRLHSFEGGGKNWKHPGEVARQCEPSIVQTAEEEMRLNRRHLKLDTTPCSKQRITTPQARWLAATCSS